MTKILMSANLLDQGIFPRYEHDCEECVFVGRSGVNDHWFCPKLPDPECIRRASSGEDDYSSFPQSVAQRIYEQTDENRAESWAAVMSDVTFFLEGPEQGQPVTAHYDENGEIGPWDYLEFQTKVGLYSDLRTASETDRDGVKTIYVKDQHGNPLVSARESGDDGYDLTWLNENYDLYVHHVASKRSIYLSAELVQQELVSSGH